MGCGLMRGAAGWGRTTVLCAGLVATRCRGSVPCTPSFGLRFVCWLLVWVALLGYRCAVAWLVVSGFGFR